MKMKLCRPYRAKIAAIILASSMVAACSSKIDATNAETMYESLSEMMKGMTEKEKRSVGQDLALLYEHRESGMSELYLDDLYVQEYYQLFVPGQMGRSSQLEVYRELLLGDSDIVNGKSAKVLRQEADEIRRQWFKARLASARERKTTVLAALPELQGQLAEYRRKLAGIEAEEAALAEKKEQLNPKLNLIQVGADRSGYFGSKIATAAVELSNSLDMPIDAVRAEISLLEKGRDKPKIFGAELKMDNGSLPSGETGRTKQISMRLPRNASQEMGDYSGSVTVKWLRFSGESERFEFNPAGMAATDLWRLKQGAKQCEALVADIQEYEQEVGAYLGRIEALSERPEEIERMPTITSVRKLEC
ncbi:hypothetical protein RM530_01470 [Algiphilus sp. W345]|uniref:Lipoprotein n=1 Tax=Banduia mediterranea TaxID=3075609 RepID=A0ABU2WFF9_9GAMM|nr:hypothetical protein [Algiphilus sp. W345]MDT0496036.1 hypothetical protein [Algiphilus sp. W345]